MRINQIRQLKCSRKALLTIELQQVERPFCVVVHGTFWLRIRIKRCVLKQRRTVTVSGGLETLVKLGYSNVKHLYGGWVVWEEGPEALEVEEEVVEESGCGG